MKESLKAAILAYGIWPEDAETNSFGNGHINDTFLVSQKQTGEKIVLQRINSYVFKKPKLVIDNIRKVTDHLRRKIILEGGRAEKETLRLLSLQANNQDFFVDKEGEYWRAYHYIDGASSFEVARSPEDMYQAGRVFGRFQRRLDDFPMEELWDTIEGFHNTKLRLEAFYEVLERDPLGRKAELEPEIDFILKREAEMKSLVDYLEAGLLPLRVTHNDTKLNNVLIDNLTGQGLCATDLDTVMPGLSLYDFGDAIRFGTNSANEDEEDQERVKMVLDYYEAYSKGYLEEAGTILTSKEKELLALGAKVITLECGMRFLMDYIDGDIYFKIHRPKQNLDRARTQFKIAKELEDKWDLLEEINYKYSRCQG